MKIPLEKKNFRTAIKKSVFIATSVPVHTESDVSSVIEEVRAQHPKCSHVVYAYSLGTVPGRILGMSGDGEPRGTAGKPALNVLLHSDLTDVLITIVRYYGGIELGKGGLVRAYTECTKQAIDGLPVKTAGTDALLQVTIGYDQFERARNVLSEIGADIIDRQFEKEVKLRITVNEELVDSLKKRLIETTKGRIEITSARTETV